MHCGSDSMRVELVQREEVKNLYLQNLKDFPGILWRFDFKEIQGASCLNPLIFSQSLFVLWHVRFTTVPFTFLSDQGYSHFLDEKLMSNGNTITSISGSKLYSHFTRHSFFR